MGDEAHQVKASVCSAVELPWIGCSSDVVVNVVSNWFAAIIGLVFLVVLGRPVANGVKRAAIRRLVNEPGGIQEFDDELRDSLISRNKGDSWGRLGELLPFGFAPLTLELEPGWVVGAEPRDAIVDLVNARRAALDIFDSSDRCLLLHGGEGFGKTVVAYAIAEELERLHLADRSEPIPLVLDLSEWTPGHEIGEWVVGEVCDQLEGDLAIQPRLARKLVKSGRFVLILDSLDRVSPEYRIECLLELNGFMAGQPVVPAGGFLVTVRTKDYEDLAAACRSLNMGAARRVGPLSTHDLSERLMILSGANGPQSCHRSWREIAEVNLAGEESYLHEALRNPLVFSLAVQDEVQGDYLRFESVDEVETAIFRAYTRKVLSGAGREELRQWLKVVSDHLTADRRSHGVFFFEHLTPDVAPDWMRRSVALTTGTMVALAVGLVGWSLVGLWNSVSPALALGVIASLISNRSAIDARPVQKLSATGSRVTPRAALGGGQVTGVLFDLSVGVLGGLIAAIFLGWGAGLLVCALGCLSGRFGLLVERRLRDRRRIAEPNSPDSGMARSLRASFSAVMLVGFEVGPGLGLIGGLLAGSIVGLAVAVVGGLSGGVVFGLCVGVAIAILAGPVVALTAGMNEGGAFVILQLLRRRRMRSAGQMPLDPVGLLNQAVDLGILRRVGGGYQFRHNKIREALS